MTNEGTIVLDLRAEGPDFRSEKIEERQRVLMQLHQDFGLMTLVKYD